MIRTASIHNFRCYQDLNIDECKRLNVIVGENGSGKTSLLEAIFFALGVTSEIGMRYRQSRGMDGSFQGSPHRIEDAIWANLFHNSNFSQPIRIELTGDGEEARSLHIAKGRAETQFDFGEGNSPPEHSEPIVLTWIDARGSEHSVRPKLTNGTAQFPSTGEDLPDFFLFPANSLTGSQEGAARFSELSRSRRALLVSVLSKEYPWIEDLSIEVSGGHAAVFAAVAGSEEKRPLPYLSGGVNRVVNILMAIASRPRSIVLIDELENGIHFRHHAAVWRILLSFMREFDSQIFVTTHSGELLKGLGKALGRSFKDVALWRTERTKKNKHVLQQFEGESLRAAIETETEVR
jgi:ABC-type Mn2+/Zn2+ transport system ATPase subunit